MHNKKFADRAVYKVLINAPIETVWSELIKTTSPRPFFWNSSWDTKEMARGNAYRMASNGGKTVAVVGEILEMEPPPPARPQFSFDFAGRPGVNGYLFTEGN